MNTPFKFPASTVSTTYFDHASRPECTCRMHIQNTQLCWFWQEFWQGLHHYIPSSRGTHCIRVTRHTCHETKRWLESFSDFLGARAGPATANISSHLARLLAFHLVPHSGNRVSCTPCSAESSGGRQHSHHAALLCARRPAACRWHRL